MNREDFKAIGFLLRRFALGYWPIILGLIAVSFIAGIAVAVQPLVLAPAVRILEAGSPLPPATSLSDLSLNNLGPTLLHVLGLEQSSMLTLVILVGVGYVVVSVLAAGLNFLAYVLAIWLRTAISRDMSVALQTHMLSLPLHFFQSHKTGDLVSRYTQDVTGTAYFLDSAPRGLMQSLVTIGLSLVLLLRTDATLALAVAGVGVAHFFITHLLSRRVRENINQQNVALGSLNAALQETFLGIRPIKSFAAEGFVSKGFRQVAEEVRRRMVRYTFIKHLEDPLRLVANAIAIAIVLVLAFHAFDQGRLSLAGFVLFLAITQRIIDPISQFFSHVLALSGMLGCAARVLDIFRVQNNMPDGRRTKPEFEHALALDRVTFGYDEQRVVLQDVSLEVRKGEVLALVGPSGVGKSTLADLFLRLYDPLQGVVRLDGIDVQEYTQSDFRRLFGVVPQECLLFNTTVKENIIFGRAFDQARLERAVSLACADEFIRDMPQGLETLVGDRGIRLSGGQRQRIAIARAVYDHPAILVLDEATSSLDTESERAVQAAIDEVIRGMTAIVIAHRLSTVINADRIAVIKGGRVEAMGSHEQLLKTCPTYEQLCRIQFAAPAEEKAHDDAA